MSMPSDFLANAKPVKPEDDFLANATAVNPSPHSGYDTMDRARSLQQDFDEAATPPPLDFSSLRAFGKSALEDLGAGAAALATPFVHPIKTAEALQPHGTEAFGGPAAILIDRALQPFLPKKGEAGGTYGKRAGGQAVGSIPALLLGGSTKGAGVGEIPAEMAERFGPGYRSPFVPAEVQNASRVAEAIRPVGGVLPHFEEDLAAELPHIKAHAAETGNPLHSQWETALAARDLGEKGLAHYRENLLQPFGQERVAVGNVPVQRGNPFNPRADLPTAPEMKSLEDIDKRISDINDLVRGATRTAKTTGQEMTAMERLGLEEEAGRLRSILYDHLSQRTGIPAEEIKALREGYGKQFSIADTIDAARRARLGQTGASAEMGGTVPFSRTGMLERAFQGLRGGQEYIANARLRRALRPFAPIRSEYPMPRAVAPAAAPEAVTLRPSLAERAGIQAERPPLAVEKVNPEPYLKSREAQANVRNVLKQNRPKTRPRFDIPQQNPPVLTPGLKARLERGLNP